MKSITLKEISGYLPYDASIQINGHVRQLTGIKKSKDESLMINYDYIVWEALGDNKKLLLYPLSMLTQEIEHNGEKFIPIEWLQKNINKKICFCDDRFMDYDDGKDKKVLHYSFYDVYSDSVDIDEILQLTEKLYEWHFDIHGLIERGLAIDKSKI